MMFKHKTDEDLRIEIEGLRKKRFKKEKTDSLKEEIRKEKRKLGFGLGASLHKIGEYSSKLADNVDLSVLDETLKRKKRGG